MRWMPLLLGLMLLAGCAAPAPPPEAPAPDPQLAALQEQVKTLTADLQAAREENETLKQQLSDQPATPQNWQQTLRSALQSPGYEATLRLIYERLHQGDTSLLKQLLPADTYMEAGIQEGQQQTYKGYESAAGVDLQPFADWARAHPPTGGTYSVIATMPGYAWAVITFPDGRHFRIFFDGWHITKILASDRPIEMS